jgi:methyl coenzyme M reductase subunit C-like uncharacterized protein (methanogenesis marker protein 7)
MVEECGPYVVQMTQQSKETFLLLIIPHFDFVIVTAGDEERLVAMEVNPSYRTIMLVKPLQ